MNTTNIKSRILENKTLIYISILSLILTVSIFYINSTTGVLGRFYRDIYLYLIEALAFNGYFFNEYSYINSLSPLIPFLTSLLFRLGFVSEVSIFFVTSVFFFFSIIGVYQLLKLRFDEIYSVFGVALYCSFTIIMHWACNGSIDIPSLSLYIWGVYFFIKALNNAKYFYISIPLLVLSVFAKYVSVIGLPVMFVYLLSKNSLIKTFKNSFKEIFGGLVLSLICTIPFIYFFITHNVYGSMTTYLSSVQSASGSGLNEVNDFLFYILNLHKIIFRYNDIIGLILLFIMVIGIIFAVYHFYKILKTYHEDNFNLSGVNDKLVFFGLFVSVIGVFLSFLLTKDYSFSFCITLFYLSICLFTLSFSKVLVNYSKHYNSFSYDLLMFTWFSAHFIFLTAFSVKAYRYGIAFVPPLVFFITYGFKKICELSPNIRFNKKILPYIGIICLFLISFGQLSVDKHDVWVDDEKSTVKWLEENVDLDNVNIWSDRPAYAWYLKKDYHYVDNRASVTNLSEEMLDKDVDYYISHEPRLTISNYTKIKIIGSETIFKRV